MAVSIDNYAGALTDLYGAQNNASTSKVENTLKGDMKNATDEELMDACKQFEAYFLEQVMKGMQKTVIKNEEDTTTSQTVDYFKDMMIQDLAKTSTELQGTGLAKQLYESMKRQYDI